MTKGVALLRDLAAQSATAHFIATKLARHFIADDPAASCGGAHCERVFARANGHLPRCIAALIETPEAWASLFRSTKRPTITSCLPFVGLELPVDCWPFTVGAFEVMASGHTVPDRPRAGPIAVRDWMERLR